MSYMHFEIAVRVASSIERDRLPELVESPVVSGAVFQILYFHRDDGTREGSLLFVFVVEIRQQIRWQRRVEGVGEQGELELNLKRKKTTTIVVYCGVTGHRWKYIRDNHLFLELHGYGVGLLEEDGVTPEVISKTSELMVLPLAECPAGQLEFALTPVALCVK